MVELLIALAVMGILGGVNAAVMSAGFDAWNHTQGRLVLQQVSNDLMEVLLEGGFDEEGIRDAVELRDAGLNAISIVPLWTDRSHTPDPLKNKMQKFTLEKHVKAGAAAPVAQIRERGKDEWVSVPFRFDYGSGKDPKRPDDTVTFTDPIPEGAEVRILYTPDAEVHPEAQMRFWWSAEGAAVWRSYAGATLCVPKRSQGVRVERLAFLYYDNLNRLLPLGRTYSAAELKRITGVKIYLLLRWKDQWKELTSFTNVRNVTTIGATISRGSILPLPRPAAIKALSLGDFYGLQGDGIVELVVRAKAKPRWKIRLQFQPGPREDRLILDRFQIEAPPGTLQTSGILQEAIAREEFVNLLSIDRTGLYDYDDDPDIKDAVIVKGGSPVVEVTQCDFEVASLFIRP